MPARRQSATSLQRLPAGRARRAPSSSCRSARRACVSALGLPSVIMMICRMSFFCASSRRRASLSPSAVFVWYGPTCALRERRERDLLGGVVEEHHVERVAGELRADQVRERERDLLGRREAVLAVQDHRVRAVEHQHRRAARAVLGLAHHQVAVVEVDRHVEVAVARERVLERRVDVEVQRVAELVRLAPAVGLDAGGEVRRCRGCRSSTCRASRAGCRERPVAEEVDALLGEVELHVAAAACARPPGPVTCWWPAGICGRRLSRLR